MRKCEVAARLPFRLLLSESEAAASMSFSLTFFRGLVDDGLLPKPRVIRGRKVHDPEELRLAARTWPREGGDEGDGVVADTWADFT